MRWAAEAYRFVPAIVVIAAMVGGLKALYRARAAAMRALALRLGFTYTKGNPGLWFVRRGYTPMPRSFRLRGYPLNGLVRTWNILEGQRDGMSVLVRDSMLRTAADRYRACTFVAVRSDQNPFVHLLPQEKIAHSNGWTALYRRRFWPLPWTLSVRRIEEHLRNFRT